MDTDTETRACCLRRRKNVREILGSKRGGLKGRQLSSSSYS